MVLPAGQQARFAQELGGGAGGQEGVELGGSEGCVVKPAQLFL